ncbi:hypothetical protein [Streptomyces sp. NBC_00467]|uniref:hypothetical protein n=1 Tax=Streptomyces sp. NBC_00467 TaxID=2975752 RepID=UPI002E19CE4E
MAAVVQPAWQDGLLEIRDTFAPTFARSEPRPTFTEFAQVMVMDLQTRNCGTIAEVLGHALPSYRADDWSERRSRVISNGDFETYWQY